MGKALEPPFACTTFCDGRGKPKDPRAPFYSNAEVFGFKSYSSTILFCRLLQSFHLMSCTFSQLCLHLCSLAAQGHAVQSGIPGTRSICAAKSSSQLAQGPLTAISMSPEHPAGVEQKAPIEQFEELRAPITHQTHKHYLPGQISRRTSKRLQMRREYACLSMHRLPCDSYTYFICDRYDCFICTFK